MVFQMLFPSRRWEKKQISSCVKCSIRTKRYSQTFPRAVVRKLVGDSHLYLSGGCETGSSNSGGREVLSAPSECQRLQAPGPHSTTWRFEFTDMFRQGGVLANACESVMWRCKGNITKNWRVGGFLYGLWHSPQCVFLRMWSLTCNRCRQVLWLD